MSFSSDVSGSKQSSNNLERADNKPNKALLFGVCGVCFVLLMVLMMFSGNHAAQALNNEDLLSMQNAKVEVLSIKVQNSYTKPRSVFGQIEAVKKSDIGFELSGSLQSIEVLEGQNVVKGQVLASLDTARLSAQKSELKSALARSKANLALAKVSQKRVVKLVDNKLEPQQSLDEAQAQLDAAIAAVEEASARVNTLEVEIRKSILYAPFDGQVVQQFFDAGTVISPGQAIFSLIASDNLEARFGLPDNTAFGLMKGQNYTLNIQNTPFTATVKSVAQQRNQATRTIDALFSININDLSLQQRQFMVAGDLVSLSVDLALPKQGAWVPISALASGIRGLWTLYVVEGDKVQTRLVSIEYSDQEKAYVSGAIKNGDLVVRGGIQRLTPKQTVKNVVHLELQDVLAEHTFANIPESSGHILNIESSY
ncbi:efflux RND transporter periplasmic adaptor subunit [Glaciecola petra]|uniref:Efflux RND transporter periplasmic adaptor subunit n=1 Tax=Glaciecola petra TaxID=3075602 RepID=A0ABU2ZSG3_9ALTE|nr:efflux RND transporter periplasmic adaptor subunit [Aestuariibacter sp. P117]MDT0595572.1 efflux RND transporter periplasmic adaptor subunit [Aestuariibacter sp. P117]